MTVTAQTQFLDITPEAVDNHVSRARKVRAQAFKAFISRLFTNTQADQFDREMSPNGENMLRSSLTAIRSAAELLRDNPGITATERRRFIDIVLNEEARLEKILPGFKGNPAQTA